MTASVTLNNVHVFLMVSNFIYTEVMLEKPFGPYMQNTCLKITYATIILYELHVAFVGANVRSR
jgi:hypothetical protein